MADNLKVLGKVTIESVLVQVTTGNAQSFGWGALLTNLDWMKKTPPEVQQLFTAHLRQLANQLDRERSNIVVPNGPKVPS